LVNESRSGSLCGRCGADAGSLAQCPRCGAALVSPERPPPVPQPDFRRLPKRRRSQHARRPVLVLVCAGVVLGLAWWAFAGRDTGGIDSAANREGIGGSAGTTAPSQTDPSQTDPSHADPSQAVPSPAASDSAAPGADRAAEQAARIDGLLSDSGDARSGLGDAIAVVSRCDRGGVAVIGRITASRREQLAQARVLKVDALAGGTELRQILVEALSFSHKADAAFLSWASRHLDGGCRRTIAKDPDYRAGLARSKDAGAAKLRFVQVWRPIAAAYDLAERKVDEI
jgi:hypothetical protein